MVKGGNYQEGNIMLKNLLLYRLILLNALAVALLGWCYAQGFLQYVYTSGGYYSQIICLGITALFAVGFLSACIRAVKISHLINRKKSGEFFQINRLKLIEKNAHIADMVNWIVTIGLIGTVIGFAGALYGISIEDIANESGIRKIIINMMEGITLAINTTIVGAVLALWLDIIRRIIQTATSYLFKDG